MSKQRGYFWGESLSILNVVFCISWTLGGRPVKTDQKRKVDTNSSTEHFFSVFEMNKTKLKGAEDGKLECLINSKTTVSQYKIPHSLSHAFVQHTVIKSTSLGKRSHNVLLVLLETFTEALRKLISK